MSKSLVTGGAGFIGSNLALELEKLGHEVTVADNMHSADRGNLAEFKGRFVSWDLEQANFPSEKYDFIFHQAAITDPRHPNDEEVYRKNVKGFENILALGVKCGARVVYASTAGLYGNGPTPMRENQPKELLTPYGKSKLRMDEMAEEWQARLPLVGLRYFNVFGPREAHKGRPASMILHLYRQMKLGKRPRIFTAGEHCRDFIYVKDVVRANLLGTTAPSGIYNVGTGVGTTFNELIVVLNRVMKTDLAPDYFDMPFDSTTYQHNTIADTKLAQMRLGFVAEWALEPAVRDYIEWLKLRD